jgi:hypothetical protein
MGVNGPRIRGTQVRENVASLGKLGPDEGEAVRDALPEDVYRRALEVSRVEWVDVAVDVLITEAVESALGHEAMLRWSRRAIQAARDTPLLGPMFEGGLALFGVQPAAFLKLLPRGWGHVYKNCGEVSVTRSGKGYATIQWSGVPEVIAQSDAYLAGVGASFEALLQITEVSCTVTHEVTAPNRVLYEAKWS